MNSNILSVAAAIAFSTLAATGCSSSSEGGGGGPGPDPMMAIESACADSAQARCDRLQACSPTLMQIRYPDESTCLTIERDTCVGALLAPGNGNNPVHTEACVAAIPSWDCPSFINNTNQPLACQQQTGSVATGDPCVASGQCQTGFCAIAPGAGCGSCALAPVAGDDCTDLTNCGPGLTCTSDTRQCERFGGNAAACGTGLPCGAGFSCVGSDAASATMGVCQPSAAQGDATCDPALKTGTGCDRNAGLVCNSTSKTCVPVVVAGAGEMCGSVNHQSQPCGASTCVGASSGVPGTCAANVGEGEACDVEAGPFCLSGARCVSTDGGTAGACQVIDATACTMN